MRYCFGRPHVFSRMSFESRLLTVVALGLAAVLFYLAVHQAMLQWQFRTRFPYWDMVGIVSLLDAIPRPGILDLYHSVRDNEHRPIVPFLFYLWDRNRFGDSDELLYRAIMVSNALLAVSLLGILAVRRQLDFPLKVLFAAIVFLSFFSIFNYENLTWQKQIHEILCVTLLSFGLLVAATVSTRADNDRNTPIDTALALLSGLLCLAATYSFGFGLTAWPAVLAHGLLRRWRWAPLFTFAAIAVFAVVTYAFTYTVLAHHTNPAEAALRPLAIARYVLHIIGGGWLIQQGSPVPTAVSVIAAPAVILSLVLTLRFYLSAAAQPSSWFGRIVGGHAAMLIIASLGVAVMVALGRLTVNEGIDSRYAVVGFLFWCALLILFLMTLRRIAAPTIVVVFALLIFAVGYLPARAFEDRLRSREQDMYRAGVMATDRLQYWPKFPALFPAGPPLFTVWHKPRPPFPSFAKRQPFGWIGANLSDLPPAPSSSRCFGFVDIVSPLPEEPRVITLTGWAFIASPDTHLRWVMVTDLSDRGLGVGKPGLARPDVRTVYAGQGVNENRDDQLFAGYTIAAVREPGQKLLMWGIDDAGRACRLGGPVG